MISQLELKRIMPHIGDRLDKFIGPVNDVMLMFNIDTPNRMAAFLAQLAHESGEFRYMRELADGIGYEGRADLGNTEPGDGPRFRGRGPIQITGRANYKAVSMALFDDETLIATPELLEDPRVGCLAAGWFWEKHKLNNLADQRDFRGITKKINGGYNGMEDRLKYYNRALEVFGAVA